MLRVVRALAEQPTAPFHEDAVRDAIVAELKCCPHVRIEHDGFGNMIARYRRGTRARPRWAFAAHMDHPGWVRGKNGAWRFLGWRVHDEAAGRIRILPAEWNGPLPT